MMGPVIDLDTASGSVNQSSPPSSPTSETAAGKRPETAATSPALLSTSDFAIEEDLASPPYRPEASSSNLTSHDLLVHFNNPYSSYPPSPAYRSRVNMNDQVHLPGNLHPAGVDKWEGELRDTKPKVHYPESVNLEPVPVISTGSVGSNKANLRIDDFPPPNRNFTGDASPAADTASLAGTDDEDSDSDYDWSGEDDLVDQEAKFEHKMGVQRKKSGWGFKRIIALLFSSLLGSTFLAGILVAPGILIHFYWYNNNPTSHSKYVEQNVQAWLFWAAANLLLSWYLAVIVDLIPIVATFIISAAWGHVSEKIKSRVELFNSVKNTFKPVLYAASGWASWVIIFGHIYNLYDKDTPSQSRAKYTQRLDQVVEFLFFFVLVVCMQRMLSHAIAFAFHATAFKDRLEFVQTSLKVIEKLRNYRPKHNNNFGRQSAGRHSAWGWSTPVLERAGFGLSKSGHGKHTASSSQHHLNRSRDDDGTDADYDDERTAVGNNSRKSTLNSFLGGTTKGKKRMSTIAASSPSVFGEHELGVLTTGSSPEPSRPRTPSTAAPFISSPLSPPNPPSGRMTPHRYPPGSASPRPSIESSLGAGETLAAAAKALKTAFLHDARNIRGDDEEDTGGGIGGALGFGSGVGSSSEAKRLARAIYYKFKPLGQGRTYLLPSDFHPAFPDITSAETAFRVFDKDNNGDISRAEIKTTLLKVYKERRFLARSMRDVGQALKSLDSILFFFALVMLFFISLSVFGVQIEASLSSVYTLFVGASFIFKSSASNAFDSIMFLFVTHPYDTGDRCFIDDEILVVKKMGLFATVFARVDGTETYYFNSQLFTKFITNVRRSGDMYENVTLQLHWKTPIEKLDQLEASLNHWLETEQNRWFVPATAIMLQSINFQRYLEVTVGIGHNGTWQDWGLRCSRKTAFHAAVQYYTRQLGIVCYEAPQPIIYANEVNDSDWAAYPTSPGFSGFEVEEPDGRVDVVYGGAASGSGSGQKSEMTPAAAAAALGVEREAGVKTALGFTPPEGLVGSHLRSRKTRSKKAMVGLAGDG
ncbi:hypothetical protein D9757_000348 [Collybiopsis confluens]|uniref:EF-hand domain-containing protein n=1 Tax=Collybiopsis confluens TaxID=2823264 RepID=A0A8H5I1U0_9AGAR|nr:hypothetical protein D9757_000348 [Collybiopsis confluens]